MTTRPIDASIDYRSIFESMPGLFVILDADLKIIDVSSAYNRATMTRREDMIGRGC